MELIPSYNYPYKPSMLMLPWHFQGNARLYFPRRVMAPLQDETLFSKRPFYKYNFSSMYFCKLCVERTWLRILQLNFYSMEFCKWCVEKTWLTILELTMRHKVWSCLQLWTWIIDTRFSLCRYEKWRIRKVFNGTWLI